jgi:hypothetical protein
VFIHKLALWQDRHVQLSGYSAIFYRCADWILQCVNVIVLPAFESASRASNVLCIFL